MTDITPKYANLMKQLKNEGKRVGIISWSPKEPDSDLDVDEFKVVPYGTSKWDVADDKAGSILYDDDDKALNTWFSDRVKAHT